MPKVIHTGYLNVRGDDGEYIKFNTVAEQTAEEQVTEIEAAGAAQVALIIEKGIETEESIPSEYTELSNDVDKLVDYANSVSLQTTVGPAAIGTADNAALLDADALKVFLVPMQEGAGTPSPENVRPIHGWTGVKITRCRENYVENKFTNSSAGGIIRTVTSDGLITFEGTTSNVYVARSENIDVNPGDIMHLSGCPSGGSATTWRLDVRDSNGDMLGNDYADNGEGLTFTIPTGMTQIRIAVRIASGVKTDSIVFKPVLCSAAARTAYDIAFPSEAGTVYGGTVDVINGVLTVDRASIVLDGSVVGSIGEIVEAEREATHLFYVNASTLRIPVENYNTDYVTNLFGTDNARTNTTVIGSYVFNHTLRFRLPESIADKPETARAWLADNPLQIVYPLAAPATYQLTPQKIALLQGKNIIFADVGDVTLSYPQDFVRTGVEILADKTGMSLTNDIIVTIGQFDPATKKGNTRANRAYTSFIPCTSAETVLTPVPGYAYVYYLYDSVGALIASHDTQYETVPYRLHNQDGYVVVMFAKISDQADSFDFSADDVAALEAATIATDRITDLERMAYERVDYGFCRRFNVATNTVSLGTTVANYERLFTSLIPCTAEEMLIPYVGYRYVYGLYDTDFQSIAAYDTDFRTLPSIIKNKGGYVRILFAPASGTLTEADVAKIRRNFRLHALPSHIIKINDSYDKPMFTLLDDDGRDNFAAYAAMLEARNARGSLAVIASAVGSGDYMSVAQLVSLRDAGHDIISHTGTHSHTVYGGNPSSGTYTNFALISDETIRSDLKMSRDFLVKYGFNFSAIAWPWGNYPTGYNAIRNNPDPDGTDQYAHQYAEDQRLRYARIAHEVGFRYGVNSTGGIITSSDMDTMWMNRVPMEADNTEYPLAYYTSLIDQCVAAKGWYILMTHANDPRYHDMDKVTAVVDYALGKGMVVDTLAKCYVKKRPLVNIGLYRDALDHITLGTSYFI